MGTARSGLRSLARLRPDRERPVSVRGAPAADDARARWPHLRRRSQPSAEADVTRAAPRASPPRPSRPSDGRPARCSQPGRSGSEATCGGDAGRSEHGLPRGLRELLGSGEAHRQCPGCLSARPGRGAGPGPSGPESFATARARRRSPQDCLALRRRAGERMLCPDGRRSRGARQSGRSRLLAAVRARRDRLRRRA
jgi:hypothetical protein